MTHVLRGCKFCLSKSKVVLIAFIVEVLTFLPTHALMAWLGLLD